MVNGNAKIAAQARAAKKNTGPVAASQLGARTAGLKLSCPICKTPLTGYKSLPPHYDSKHPKVAYPPEGDFQ